MSWIDKIRSALVILVSTIISFFIVEYSYRYILDMSTNVDYQNRTMLFDVGNNFRNHVDFFKYFPSKEIRSTTLYSKVSPKSHEDIVIEYDYLIRTNNIGLVMQKDVFPNERAIFVIGDSYTEGQGASPWFYDLENSYDMANTKIINLGILGTGPQQWENLASSTAKELQLDVIAIIVNIIPADMERGVWIFKERELDCLYRASCNYTLGFQGYKFTDYESHEDIKRAVFSNLVESETIVVSDLNIDKIKDMLLGEQRHSWESVHADSEGKLSEDQRNCEYA